MKLEIGEVITITDADWAVARSHQSKTVTNNEARVKGLAIDAAVKRLMDDHSQEKTATQDMKLFGICHEIKSTTGGDYISISPREKEAADERLAKGEDTLIWIYDQGADPNTCTLAALVYYSKLKLHRSQYDMWVLKEGEWEAVKGWYFYRATAIRNSEKLD